jgi:hypothetical protein
MTWGGVPQTDVIPFHFHQAPLAVIETALVPSPPVCYTEWSPLPPEPPPKVTSLS